MKKSILLLAILMTISFAEAQMNLNEIANAIKEIIPSHMIDARLKRYAIRL